MGGIPQGAMEGGAVMPKDGRYSARSHGRRCGYTQGWTVWHKQLIEVLLKLVALYFIRWKL